MKFDFHSISFLLLIIGGFNWLALGAFNWEIGQLFGGMDEPISKTIYILVGLAAVYELLAHKNLCKKCGAAKNGSR